MREIDKIAEGLFEKIRDRFEDVSLGNDKAKATSDPEKARFFNFDYVVNDHNHGNITMSLIDETSLKVYFSKNISKDLNEEERHQWYSFLRELREFARRNLLSFEPRDITRSTLKHRDIAQQSKADSTYDKDEVVAESRMYGTLNRSYESFGPVRIKLAHTKPIMDESHGARSRNIEAVFVENDQGERFRLPFTSLTGARAMARHVSAGGVPTDELGQHITEMVNEMMTLRPFIRGVQRRTFEDTMTKEMIESAFGYHGLLKNTLKKLKGKRGYTEYKETFKPALVEDEANVEELKELFVKKTLDERIEQALPLVHKAYNIMKENNNPFSQQFADKKQRGETPSESIVEMNASARMSNITTIALLSGFLGAKVFHLLETPSEIHWETILVDLLTSGGWTFYGGLICGAAGVLWYTNKHGMHWRDVFDAGGPAMMLSYGLGRFGCHFSGDGDWGIANLKPNPGLPDWAWAYKYPHNVLGKDYASTGMEMIPGCSGEYCYQLSVPVYPTPLYEALMALGLFAVMWFVLRKRNLAPFQMFSAYMMMAGVERMLIESIREHGVSLYNVAGMSFSQAQMISLALMLFGVMGWIWAGKSPRALNNHEKVD